MTLDSIMEKKLPLILETFVSEVRVYQLVPGHKSNTEIANQIEPFLSAVVYALRRGHEKDPEALRLAGFHGEQRARLGYDLRALLAEFGILRSTIVEIASQNEAATVPEVERLAEILHASMIEAATRFNAQSSRVTASSATRAALRPGSASR